MDSPDTTGVQVSIGRDRTRDLWLVRCEQAGVDYAGDDLADAAGQIDRAVGADTRLDLETDLGEDTDYYLILAAYYRDAGQRRKMTESSTTRSSRWASTARTPRRSGGCCASTDRSLRKATGGRVPEETRPPAAG